MTDGKSRWRFSTTEFYVAAYLMTLQYTVHLRRVKKSNRVNFDFFPPEGVFLSNEAMQYHSGGGTVSAKDFASNIQNLKDMLHIFKGLGSVTRSIGREKSIEEIVDPANGRGNDQRAGDGADINRPDSRSGNAVPVDHGCDPRPV